MRKGLYIFVPFLFASMLCAQTGKRTIVEELNTSKSGQGKVRVFQDEAIKNVVGIQSSDTLALNDGALAVNFVKAKGYKITLYSGNSQGKSRQEAESKKAQFKNIHPDIEAVVSSKPPYWRLRVGNYLTREEAVAAMSEFKKTLPPALSREMRVSEDVIKRPVE